MFRVSPFPNSFPKLPVDPDNPIPRDLSPLLAETHLQVARLELVFPMSMHTQPLHTIPESPSLSVQIPAETTVSSSSQIPSLRSPTGLEPSPRQRSHVLEPPAFMDQPLRARLMRLATLIGSLLGVVASVTCNLLRQPLDALK